MDKYKCRKDGKPCLHVPCCESQGVGCCEECLMVKACTTACFKVREVRRG